MLNAAHGAPRSAAQPPVGLRARQRELHPRSHEPAARISPENQRPTRASDYVRHHGQPHRSRRSWSMTNVRYVFARCTNRMRGRDYARPRSAPPEPWLLASKQFHPREMTTANGLGGGKPGGPLRTRPPQPPPTHSCHFALPPAELLLREDVQPPHAYAPAPRLHSWLARYYRHAPLL